MMQNTIYEYSPLQLSTLATPLLVHKLFSQREYTFMKFFFTLSIKSITFVPDNRRNMFVVQLFCMQTLYFPSGCFVYVNMEQW